MARVAAADRRGRSARAARARSRLVLCWSKPSPASVTTWSRLVDPGVPKGTPATMISGRPPRRSRGAAPCAWPWRSSPRNCRRRVVRDRMRAPQQRRCAAPVLTEGVSTMIGTVGRSRATRRAVEPERGEARRSPIGRHGRRRSSCRLRRARRRWSDRAACLVKWTRSR